MSKPNPFAGEVDALSGADFALLQQAVETRKCREEIGVGNYDAAARKWRPLPPCPDCGADGCVKAGTTPAGHQRWLCGECGRHFAYLDGTVFEGAKKPLFTWVLFIRLMCYNVQLDAAAELCGMSHQTAWEWRHRVMETIDGPETVAGGTGGGLTRQRRLSGWNRAPRHACGPPPRTRRRSASGTRTGGG